MFSIRILFYFCKLLFILSGILCGKRNESVWKTIEKSRVQTLGNSKNYFAVEIHIHKCRISNLINCYPRTVVIHIMFIVTLLEFINGLFTELWMENYYVWCLFYVYTHSRISTVHRTLWYKICYSIYVEWYGFRILSISL